MNHKRGRAPIREAKEFDEEVIQIDRVTRVVKGGRRLRFRATVAIGNHKGKVGVGIGKSSEVQGAIQKAIAQAKKSLIQVPMAGQTIPHRIQIKFKSARLKLMPACPGTGIIAGGPLRKIIELAGVKDIMSKSLGSNNRLSNSQAAIMALSQLQTLPWLAKKMEAAKTASNKKNTAAATEEENAQPTQAPVESVESKEPAEAQNPAKPLEKESKE